MKNFTLLFILIVYSLTLSGQVTDTPHPLYLDPTCSSPAYQECSIEVAGYIYYSFSITKLYGDLDVTPSLNYSNCTDWDQYVDNDYIVFQSVGSANAQEVELILTMDTEDQLPGTYAKIRLTTIATNYFNVPGWYVTQNKDIWVYINEPTTTAPSSAPLCYGSNRTITISDYPTSGISSIDWDLSSILTEVSSTSNTVTVTPASSSSTGVGWVKPKYIMPCSDEVLCPKIDVIVGKFQNVVVTGDVQVCPNSLVNYTAQIPGGHLGSYSYSWTKPSNWSLNSQSTNHIQYYTPSSPDYGTVRVSVTNSCGTGNYSGITVYPSYNCGGYYMMMPNPSTEYIDLAVNPELSTSFSVMTENEVSLSIFDKMGIVVYTGKVTSLPYRIDTNSMRKGEYIARIHTRKKGGNTKEQRVESIMFIVK